ncbi:type II toxin-antitoxin system Phd/YefM family antitoxin [Croceibacterium ferulae]|uniref:type II toxin-antitoxin system Phd/YefM family antitoxin n=1 Tax=Croceibacterium ferulae TaxID=1854641 RepID=UPI000EAEBE9E|nr:type II toxin-antitoxin system Phd/YefM family antitoxin [Croceibacterium ferulae]
METVNIHQAKTHLSRLLEQVAGGDSVIIAKAGRPIARLVPIEQPTRPPRQRTGFMAGQLRVPADFDRMGDPEIEALFGGHR